MKPLAFFFAVFVAWVAGLFLGAMVMPRESGPVRSEADLARIAALQAEVDVQNATITRLQGEVDELLSQNINFHGKLETAELCAASEGELEQCRDHLAQYRDGLQDATAQLDKIEALTTRVGGRRLADALSIRPTDKTGPFLRQPEFHVIGDDVAVAGSIHNGESEPILGQLKVELFVRGRSIGTQSLPMELEPRTVTPYSTSFRAEVGGQEVRVKASWSGL